MERGQAFEAVKIILALIIALAILTVLMSIIQKAGLSFNPSSFLK